MNKVPCDNEYFYMLAMSFYYILSSFMTIFKKCMLNVFAGFWNLAFFLFIHNFVGKIIFRSLIMNNTDFYKHFLDSFVLKISILNSDLKIFVLKTSRKNTKNVKLYLRGAICLEYKFFFKFTKNAKKWL